MCAESKGFLEGVCITERLEDSSFEDPRSVVKNPRHDANVTNLEPTNISDIR